MPRQTHNLDPATKAYFEQCGGIAGFAERHGVTLRTAERFYSGTKPLPNRLRDEIAALLDPSHFAQPNGEGDRAQHGGGVLPRNPGQDPRHGGER